MTTTHLKLQTATESIYTASVAIPKVDILLLYSRIFTGKRTRTLALIILAVVVLHWATSGVIAIFAIRTPFGFKWDVIIPGGICAELILSYRYISIPNIITDLAIMLLPQRTLFKLRLPKTEKFNVFPAIMTCVWAFIHRQPEIFFDVFLQSRQLRRHIQSLRVFIAADAIRR